QMALNASPECVTYTLDLPPEQAAQIQLSTLDELVSKHFKEKFRTCTGSYFAGRGDVKIIQLLGDSATFDYSVVDAPLDLIFIDAPHVYENKKRDCENPFRLLSPKGFVLWNNYADVCCPEVTKCLCDYAAHQKIWHLRNTYLAVYSPAAAP